MPSSSQIHQAAAAPGSWYRDMLWVGVMLSGIKSARFYRTYSEILGNAIKLGFHRQVLVSFLY